MATPGIAITTDNSKNTWFGTAGDDAFMGNGSGQTFVSGLGDDTVHAGGGNDFLIADLGNDWLDGGSGIDALSFYYVAYTPAFSDISPVGVTVDLQKSKQDMGYFGVKTIYGFEDVYATDHDDQVYGNSADNLIYAYSGNDRIDGRGGNDTLYGFDGADTLLGGDGNDLMIGGTGADRFFSGLGADSMAGEGVDPVDDGARDVFIYSSIKYSGTTDATRDTIFGTFDGAAGDKIDLSGIDANGSKAGDGKFTFIGSKSFGSNSTSEVQVRATGLNDGYLVKIDIDSDNGSEMQIIVYSSSLLTASDFIL